MCNCQVSDAPMSSYVLIFSSHLPNIMLRWRVRIPYKRHHERGQYTATLFTSQQYQLSREVTMLICVFFRVLSSPCLGGKARLVEEILDNQDSYQITLCAINT